jgi:hypothetical protein
MSTPNTSSEQENADPIAEIHEIRRRMAADANFDPHEMGRRLREQQRRDGRPVYRTERGLVPVETVYSAEEADLSCVVREEPPAK